MGSIICRRPERLCSPLSILCLFVFALSPSLDSQASEQDAAVSSAPASTGAGESLFKLLIDDGRYFFGSLYSDMGDLLKLPLQVPEIRVTDVLLATGVLAPIPTTI